MSSPAYILAATRLPVGRRNGYYKNTRPDDLLAAALKAVLAQMPQLDPMQIDEVIVGCAVPEAEQGLNVARMGLLLAGIPDTVPGFTINRFCASGLEAVALAAQRIQSGMADIVIAAGTESMSVMSNMLGNKMTMNPRLFAQSEFTAMAYGMGITAEKVALRWQVSRADQDEFAAASHQKALAAQAAKAFDAEITPFTTTSYRPDLQNLQNGQATIKTLKKTHLIDEGPRRESTQAKLATLKPVFQVQGSVTAGNASQMSDGSAAVIVLSERALKALNASPLARFAGYSVAGVPPEIMGIGPIEAIPRALKHAGITQNDVDWFELNEAFAAQALAVIRSVKLDPKKVNPLGGAIALGHPLGATGAIRTATLLHGLRRLKKKWGVVTMCIGTGMGAAGVFEAL